MHQAMIGLLLLLGSSPPRAADCLCKSVVPSGGTPSLVIQVVTEDWLPHPNARVRVSGRFEDTQAASIEAATDIDGILCFHVPYDALYAIDFKAQAGFDAVHRDVRLFKASQNHPVAYVQVVTPVSVK